MSVGRTYRQRTSTSMLCILSSLTRWVISPWCCIFATGVAPARWTGCCFRSRSRTRQNGPGDISDFVWIIVYLIPGIIRFDRCFEVRNVPTSDTIAALSRATFSLGLLLSNTRSESRKAWLNARANVNPQNAESQTMGRNRHVGWVVILLSHSLRAYLA
jgi:hypothetical protein